MTTTASSTSKGAASLGWDLRAGFAAGKEHRAEVERAWKDLRSRQDLGFLQLPMRTECWSAAVSVARQVSGFREMKVLGMGGSGLGGRMLFEALRARDGWTARPVEFIADSHPESLALELQRANEHTLWCVISKSGTTLETLSQLMALEAWLEERKIPKQRNVVVITEPTRNPLHTWALEAGVTVLDHPLDVGGRFSVLSPVGIFPAAWSGLDTEALRQGAAATLEEPELALDLAADIAAGFRAGKSISVLWAYSHRLRHFVPWLQQLWAESLGKSPNVAASTPVPSYGTCDQHSVLQQYMEGARDKHVFIFREATVAAEGFRIAKSDIKALEFVEGRRLGEIYLAESHATEMALREVQVPVTTLSTATVDASRLGALIMTFEIVIGLLGGVLGVDAFNQPGVERGKILAREMLRSGGLP
jgi:glucose-6-phosphate isomerase